MLIKNVSPKESIDNFLKAIGMPDDSRILLTQRLKNINIDPVFLEDYARKYKQFSCVDEPNINQSMQMNRL